MKVATVMLASLLAFANGVPSQPTAAATVTAPGGDYAATYPELAAAIQGQKYFAHGEGQKLVGFFVCLDQKELTTVTQQIAPYFTKDGEQFTPQLLSRLSTLDADKRERVAIILMNHMGLIPLQLYQKDPTNFQAAALALQAASGHKYTGACPSGEQPPMIGFDEGLWAKVPSLQGMKSVPQDPQYEETIMEAIIDPRIKQQMLAQGGGRQGAAVPATAGATAAQPRSTPEASAAQPAASFSPYGGADDW